jgi:hypothetical protein
MDHLLTHNYTFVIQKFCHPVKTFYDFTLSVKLDLVLIGLTKIVITLVIVISRGVFVPQDHSRSSFFRWMQDGTAFQNLFSLALV